MSFVPPYSGHSVVPSQCGAFVHIFGRKCLGQTVDLIFCSQEYLKSCVSGLELVAKTVGAISPGVEDFAKYLRAATTCGNGGVYKRLKWTGHSLGGAAATLAGAFVYVDEDGEVVGADGREQTEADRTGVDRAYWSSESTGAQKFSYWSSDFYGKSTYRTLNALTKAALSVDKLDARVRDFFLARSSSHHLA